MPEGSNYAGFKIKALDHHMAIKALETMKDDGRAAIIVGGHTRWDELGRIKAGENRIFFNYLYHHFNVADVVMIDGKKLYSRQGTSFDVRLILISGRKPLPEGAAPLYDKDRDVVISTFEDLYDRVIQARAFKPAKAILDIAQLRKRAAALKSKLSQEEDLGAPYIPASDACVKLDTQVPDSMSFEIHDAVARVKKEVGGDIDAFVRHRLGYSTKVELCKALSAEQIDAVAFAIYNIEAKSQGMIIGDQTGIGKGRIAAAIIRYAVVQGKKPIFLTEKANLFSDLYRDLEAIGSGFLKPFIVNAREPKTDIKDQDGNVIYTAPAPTEQAAIIAEQKLPDGYDFVISTYTQFNSPMKKPEKPAFLSALAKDNILVMDEAHNSSGSSNTGEFMQPVVASASGVVFLSATFAKRPDNMPIYAMKTAISDANMTRDELVDAIMQGGVALQEILSSQLVAEGQMIRRERSFEGVEVNYINLDHLKEEHLAICDNITEILREIIAFQEGHITSKVKELDKIAAAEGKASEVTKGTSKAGVDNVPYFSKVFNVINQMLFSIKAEAVADRAIMRIKEGKKPVIAFSSTMAGFIEQMENEHGMPVGDGDLINSDFSEVLKRGLEGVMRYTEKDITGASKLKKFDITSLTPEAKAHYQKVSDMILKASTGISISPIDVVIQKIEDAGYSVAEVTGRKFKVQLNWKNSQGLILSRKRENTNDAFRRFNNNEADVLLINQAGSTGASAHAIPTSKVPAEKVKQRVMIVLQAELDISTEVQKRGRINRTGQILKPIYDYVISAIPAEKRLMMMLQSKLKSLDANTTSNQKQSSSILNVPDFLNKYGDKVVKEYLEENPEINMLLGDPLGMVKGSSKEQSEGENEDDPEYGKPNSEDAAKRVSGRVAVLSTKMQQEFYDEITAGYNDYVEYLKQIDEYDLEVETMNLKAETLRKRIVRMGKGGDSPFGEDSVMETVMADILKKPFSKIELDNLLKEAVGLNDPLAINQQLLIGYQDFVASALNQENERTKEKYRRLIQAIPEEKKIQQILEKHGLEAQQAAIEERRKELSAAEGEQLQLTTLTFTNRASYVESLLSFFYPGKLVKYPVGNYINGEQLLGVCLGFQFDMKKKNPYAPSNFKIRFALASGQKYIAMKGSLSEPLRAIMGATGNLVTPDREELLFAWEKAVKERSMDRGVRHIITGNLLQAFSSFHGKLVSYTKLDGTVEKGILMPEHYLPQEREEEEISVPVLAARNLIKSLVSGNVITTNAKVTFGKMGDEYRVFVPASRKQGGDVYLDKDLLALVRGNNFEKTSTSMVAYVSPTQIDEFIETLQKKHNDSITIPADRAHLLEKVKSETIRRKIALPPPEEEAARIPPIELLRLKAKALKIKLLLTAAA